MILFYGLWGNNLISRFNHWYAISVTCLPEEPGMKAIEEFVLRRNPVKLPLSKFFYLSDMYYGS